ncbi:hypothetical protein [Caminibacter sp.]
MRNLTDLKIYGAVLVLLKNSADVTPRLISEVSGVPLSTVYRKINNYYIIENQIKRRENGKRKIK